MYWSAPWLRYYFGAFQSTVPQARLQPGQVVERDASGIEWVYIPAGRLSAGRYGYSGYSGFDINIERPFLISKAPVTQAQWRYVAKNMPMSQAATPATAAPGSRVAPIPAQPLFPGQARPSAPATAPQREQTLEEMLRTGQGGSVGPGFTPRSGGSWRVQQASAQQGAGNLPPYTHSPINLPPTPSVHAPGALDAWTDLQRTEVEIAPNRPVTDITYIQAEEFVRRIDARIPTYAEWLYALAGGVPQINRATGLPGESFARMPGVYAEDFMYPRIRTALSAPYIWEKANALYDKNKLTPENLSRALFGRTNGREFQRMVPDAQDMLDILEDPSLAANALRIEVEKMRAIPASEWFYRGPLNVGTKPPNAYGLYDMVGNVKVFVKPIPQVVGSTPFIIVGSGYNDSGTMREDLYATWAGSGAIGLRPVRDIEFPPPTRVELIEMEEAAEPATSEPAPSSRMVAQIEMEEAAAEQAAAAQEAEKERQKKEAEKRVRMLELDGLRPRRKRR